MRRLLILAAVVILAAGSVGCGRFPYFRRGAACATCPTVGGAPYGDVVVPPVGGEAVPAPSLPTVPPDPSNY